MSTGRLVGRSTSRLTALGIIIIRLAADLTPTDQCVNTVLLCLTLDTYATAHHLLPIEFRRETHLLR